MHQAQVQFQATATGAGATADGVDEESLEQIRLLTELHKLMTSKDKNKNKNTSGTVGTSSSSSARARQVIEVVRRFESLTYSGVSYRVRAFLKKVCMELWKSYLYPAVQEVLSDLQLPPSDDAAACTPAAPGVTAGANNTVANSKKLLKELAPGLLTAVKVLDLAALEDPVFMGCMALLASQVQWELGDHRGSIAVTQQAIYTLDEHRMGRVDALQHIPEDVRDIYALQRGSFSTRGDNQDWFHSLKRLGAHAFAG